MSEKKQLPVSEPVTPAARVPTTTAARVPTTPVWWVIGPIAGLAILGFCLIAFDIRPASSTLIFELAKTCLQVFGVAIVGGLVTLTFNVWHEERKQIAQEDADANRVAAQAVEADRKRNEVALERQRQQYKLRISLVDRMTRCAQTMYVVFQHVRRIQKDSTRAAPRELPPGTVPPVSTPEQARAQLDRAYVDFSSEAAALETEIRAWYGRGRTLPDADDAAETVAETIDPPKGTDESWHQIVDLLTVYYFALCGDFRVDVLAKNSPHQGQPHSNVAFEKLVRRDESKSGLEIIPDTEEVREVIGKIRRTFHVAMTDVARSALEEPLMDFTHSHR